MQGIRGDDGRIITRPPYGGISQDSHETYPGGERWWRVPRNLCGVLPTSVETSGVSGEQVPGKDTQPGNTQRAIYVMALEVKNSDPKGGIETYPAVIPMWDAHADGEVMA